MTSTSVGMRCPECARQRTEVRTARTLTDEPTLTYVLIGINVVAYLGMVLGGGGLSGGGPLLQEGQLIGFAVGDGQVWRILTSGFLHGGLFHLFLNMFGLYILGGLLEPAIGKLRFGLIYFVSLLTGSFAVLLAAPQQPTVGASGAIFGLLGAAIVVMRSRGINPLESGLVVILGLNLLITFLYPGISIAGHLGGLAGGTLAALVLFDLQQRVRVPAAVATALVVGLGVLAVTGSIVVSAA